ncbi:MAG: DUF4383 domain-containing protein [Minisyncoccota bacterium]
MAKKLALAVGVILTAVGVLGFVPGVTSADGLLLGIFEVDTMHNVVHILTGVLALLAAMGSGAYGGLYFKVFGVVYALVAALGLAMGSPILGLISANMADHVLHIALAAVFLYAGFGMKSESAPVMSSMSSNPVM